MHTCSQHMHTMMMMITPFAYLLNFLSFVSFIAVQAGLVGYQECMAI